MEKLISIIGQTSSGKSDLAVCLAKKFNGEIVSADSRQVYRGLDYCSGKITVKEMQGVPHKMIDVVELNTQYSLYDFQKRCYLCIDDIIKRGRLPFLVGGTGLYTRSIVQGFNLDEATPDFNLRSELQKKSVAELVELCTKLNISIDCKQTEFTARRLVRLIEKQGKLTENTPKYDVLQIGIKWNRETIYKRIKERLEKRIPNMISEIQGLLGSGVDKNFLIGLGLEAKNVVKFLDGEFNGYDEFFEQLFKEERHFAKRQQTWYNKEKNVIWLDAENKSKAQLILEAEKIVQEFLDKK